MILLDTHAWLWWVSSPAELSSRARKAINKAASDKLLYVSSISCWEVALLVSRGRLQLSIDVVDWVAKSEALSCLSFVPVSNAIAIRSVQLPGTFHPDPADRIIVATSLNLGAHLVSADRKIRAYRHVKTVW